MLHQNPTARRRSGGFKSVRRQAGIALAQLAVAIGLAAVLVAAAITAGLDLAESGRKNEASDELATFVIALGNVRARRPHAVLHGGTAAEVQRWLRGAGSRNFFASNAFGNAVTIDATDEVVIYPAQTLENCEEIADVLAAANQVNYVGQSAGAPTARAAADPGGQIDIHCESATTGATVGNMYIEL